MASDAVNTPVPLPPAAPPAIRFDRVLRWLGVPLRAVQHVVYPPLCLVCDVDLEAADEFFCTSCRGEMVSDQPSCPKCAASVGLYSDTSNGCLQCRRDDLRFDAALRLGVYADKLRELCLSFKHARNVMLGPALGGLLVRHLGGRLAAIKPDMVVAVPLHWWRRVGRGFNQAESLAAHLAAELKLPHRSRILKRVRMTRPQSELKRGEREDNVRDAFRATADPTLKRATVLLVDDILTTGATCSEAARALKAGGAARVVAVVVARSEEQPSV